jgi:hypothetical protein
MFSKKLLAVAGITLPVALIAGCGELIVAEDGGAGSCDGSPFTIAATVSEDATNYTIDYTGPSGVSLILSPGFYIEDTAADVTEVFGGLEFVPEGSGYFATLTNGIEDNSVDYLRFDTTNAGWTTGGSGVATSYSFEGSYATLIGGYFGPLDEEAAAPTLVGVVCDELTSRYLEDSTPTADGFIDDITIQAAVEMIPNHLLLNPFEILNQEVSGGGFAGDARFAAGSASIFGDFTPTEPYETFMFPDDPSVPNNSFSELWFQAMAASDFGPPPFEVQFPEGVSLDGDFPFQIEPFSADPASAPEAGNYLMMMLMGDDPYNPSGVRVVFMNTYYNPASGVTFLDPLGEPVNPTAPDLADTGVDASAIGIGAGALLAGGVALGAVAAVRRARAKN